MATSGRHLPGRVRKKRPGSELVNGKLTNLLERWVWIPEQADPFSPAVNGIAAWSNEHEAWSIIKLSENGDIVAVDFDTEVSSVLVDIKEEPK